MKKNFFILFLGLMSLCRVSFATTSLETPVNHTTSIIGGGIIGALESYYAFQDAEKNGEKICITIYEKGSSFGEESQNSSSTNTSYNIVPSLTVDEILSVIPRGPELVEKLALSFTNSGGLCTNDVAGINDSESAANFKTAAELHSLNIDNDDRRLALLGLGKKSMELRQQMYDEADIELKSILEASNFNPCREPKNSSQKSLHDGYRIDLIYRVPNAQKKAFAMKADYEKLGYTHCTLLSPQEVVAIDPYLADFCNQHSVIDMNQEPVWHDDTVALWRPGGCIDTHIFLPRFYSYLRKKMGQYKDAENNIHDCFQLHFGKKVCGIIFDSHSLKACIAGLQLSDGTYHIEPSRKHMSSQYVFCPGESVGTLHTLGFQEPAYAGFAGASLLMSVPLPSDQVEKCKNFSHCMEIHSDGIALAWQARNIGDTLFIGIAGTKAFYGEKQPNKDEAFAKNRNLVQLNMINDILPEYLSLACGYQTKNTSINEQELVDLEQRGIAHRWVGRRAVAYDGFPTIGALYYEGHKVINARCTTHLGSGGVSFGPGAVFISRNSQQKVDDSTLVTTILKYSDSRRTAAAY